MKKENCIDISQKTNYKIPNKAGKEVQKNILFTFDCLIKPLQDKFGEGSFSINSWYRSPNLNVLVKGSAKSDHLLGYAIDIHGVSVKNSELFDFLKRLEDTSQIIWEFGNDKEPAWVHVSCNPNKFKSILKSKKNEKGTVYEKFS